MSRFDHLSERILRAIVGRISGRTLTALVLLLYAGGGLALPTALKWSVPGIALNFFWTMLAGLLILVWVTQRIEARERRHLVEWTTELRHLNAEEFEWLVGEVFQREGWEVRQTGSQERPDGNIDIELTRDGQRTIVQCKLWQSWRVGVKQIREFAGTLMREGLPASAGIFVTIADIREAARAEARKIGIALGRQERVALSH